MLETLKEMPLLAETSKKILERLYLSEKGAPINLSNPIRPDCAPILGHAQDRNIHRVGC